MSRGRLRAGEAMLARGLGWLDRHAARLSRGRLRLHAYWLMAQPVGRTPLLPAGRGRRIVVRDVAREESEHLDFPRPRSVIRRRYDEGGRCLGAFRDDDMVGFLWLQSGAYAEDEVRCWFRPEPPERCAWDYDVYVRPDMRLSPVFARLWDAAFERLRAEGVEWTLSRVAAVNAASLAAHDRLEARRVGRAWFLTVGPLQLSMATVAPYAHLSASRNSGPTLRLPTPSP